MHLEGLADQFHNISLARLCTKASKDGTRVPKDGYCLSDKLSERCPKGRRAVPGGNNFSQWEPVRSANKATSGRVTKMNVSNKRTCQYEHSAAKTVWFPEWPY